MRAVFHVWHQLHSASMLYNACALDCRLNNLLFRFLAYWAFPGFVDSALCHSFTE